MKEINTITSEEFQERVHIWHMLIKQKKKDASKAFLDELEDLVTGLDKPDSILYNLMRSRYHLLCNERETAFSILKELQKDMDNAADPLRFYFHYFLGMYYDRKHEFSAALKEYELAEELSGHFTNQADEADYRYEMGTVYYHMDLNSKSLFHLEKAYHLYKELPVFKEQLAHAEISLGLNYTDIGFYELAEEYIHSGLKHYMELNLDTYQHIAYHNLALLYKKQKMYEAAIRYFNQVIAAEPPFLLESLYHLTESLIHNGKLQEASNHVAEGLQLATKLQNQDFIHRYNVLLATHFEVGDVEETLSQAVHYFLDNEKDHDIPVYAKLLANYYESISNFEEANHYNKIALAIMEKKN
ncbi:tetratricopeptide repeat protein [Terribacillus saccharophilus]|uniref:tetratricopeptide repeat protein n=1 Tax=Terribacillus saccharophilus TaxID=361277 RepID=UPI000BA685B6|nr:tetratricopeptide repeat protein [Terribacillus saccharophilus]PAF15891.1 hypothetical protein CHH51_18240 [Terribacillus saccharophilus]